MTGMSDQQTDALRVLVTEIAALKPEILGLKEMLSELRRAMVFGQLILSPEAQMRADSESH